MTVRSGEDGSVARPHVPVLLAEVIEHLAPRDGGSYIDATFGAGGYARAILDAADASVLALDRDPSAISAGAAMVAKYAGRLRLEQRPFGSLLETADEAPGTFDGIVLDLGVSSMQIDQPERGFSFQSDGPLDMRMSSAPGIDPDDLGPSAADVVNTMAEGALADVIYQLGEERRSRAIASAIVKRRGEKKIERTSELASIVVSVLGRGKHDAKHPATRTFQALRLYVNEELGELARVLTAAEILLKPGGRLVVVTFHSLEDRIAKQFIAARTGRTPSASRHLPALAPQRAASFRIVNSKAVAPGDAEIATNPRSRSAKLRAAERTDAPAWPLDVASLGLPPAAAAGTGRRAR